MRKWVNTIADASFALQSHSNLKTAAGADPTGATLRGTFNPSVAVEQSANLLGDIAIESLGRWMPCQCFLVRYAGNGRNRALLIATIYHKYS